VWANVLAGLVLAGGPVSFSHVLLLAVAMSCFYIGGMFLNDAFDREHDRRERPERPIPAGQITTQEVLAIGFGLLTVGLLCLGVFATGTGWQLIASGILLTLLIIFYDLHHKQNPWSPFVMAGCRAMIYIIAAFSLAPILPLPVLIGAAVLFCYAVGLSFLAKFETAPRPGPLWPFVFLLSPFAAVLLNGNWSLGTALLMAGVLGCLGYITWRTIHAEGPLVRRATGLWLAGISLLDAALIAEQGLLDLAMYAVIGSGLTAKLQQRVGGT
jgi:4-hydroxybenzoate polyprenyltransferase